jgi:hypothetical protein
MTSPGPGDDGAGADDPKLSSGICVLGMHRSGTSLVAGILRLLGVDLGPDEDFLPPDSNNQSGYFELADLVEINNEILAHYGGSWDELPELPPGWERSEDLAPLHDRSRRTLVRRFAASPQWAWKDPRTCITLPFWQRLVSGLRYVICVRNPIDIAHSLRAREGEEPPLEEHVVDWLRHTASALVHTADRPRIVVHYEQFLEDPEHNVRKLAGFLGCEDRLEDHDAMAGIFEFVDPALVHARSAPSTVADHPEVPLDAAALYLTMELAAELDAGAGGTGAHEAWASINSLARRCLPQSGVEVGERS